MAAQTFYVYELFDEFGAVQYVGKGSGRRLHVQQRKHALQGRIVREFAKEADAYAFEIQHIAACRPALNTHKGGNGCRVTPAKPVRDVFYALCSKIGTQAVAARLILAYGPPESKTDEVRKVAAYG